MRNSCTNVFYHRRSLLKFLYPCFPYVMILAVTMFVCSANAAPPLLALYNADVGPNDRHRSFSLISHNVLDKGKGTFRIKWHEYQQRFISKSGYLTDSYHKISHSEGQGTAMLFAAWAGDKSSFDTVWMWTKHNLQRKDKLFAWRWDKSASPHITDNNNASDGDILIAWALLKAYEFWQTEAYLVEALQIMRAIRERLIYAHQGYHILLPGSRYFVKPEGIEYNASYVVLPALLDFARYGQKPALWLNVYRDSLRLVNQARKSDLRITTDWMLVNNKGRLLPVEKREPLLGYDVIRVPLYLAWCGHDNYLKYYQDFWRQQGGWRSAPSWVNTVTGSHADYPPELGILSVRALAYVDRGGQSYLFSEHKLEDYYSASLYLFSLMAAFDKGEC